MKSFDELFVYMVEKRATHLHLIPGSPIMMRQGKNLLPIDTHILSPADTAKIANALLTDKQKRKFEESLEVDFSYSIPGLSRYRINVFRQRGSISMIIATHPPAAPTIEELGLPDYIKNMVAKARSGLMVICGPKASGKSYTLAAFVNFMLESRACQIVTLENPIDFLHKNKKGLIVQREKETDFVTFENAMASLKHQDCDILVVTEFEDLHVIKTCLNLAAGGNFVIATAQAPGSIVMLEKIVDTFPPHQRSQALSLMGVGLNCVIAQSLLEKASGGGLIPAFEILTNAPAVRTYLKEDKFIQIRSFMQTGGREYGMRTQEQALRQMVKKNLVTMEEALSKSNSPEEFKKVMSLPY